ncbi:MAG: hypothetical protein IPP90_05305 [Gemmatimonadaceae bacterium]|nr:hypothetical protein [Gemmatimonadaceae bacterium]
MTARAALDAALNAARAAFELSLGPSGEATALPVWRETPEALATPYGRGVAMWRAAEVVLQAVVGRPELTGQALVGEARRLQMLTLGDAHALMALQGWVDRVRNADDANTSAPVAEGERGVAREAWLALEHVVDRPSDASGAVTAKPAIAPPPNAPPPNAPPPNALPPNALPPNAPPPNAPPVTSGKPWYASAGLLFGALMLLVIGGAGAWMLLAGRRGRDFNDGVAAYERGARDVARTAFGRFAQDHPDDARPLVYLGRLAREDRDLARSRRFLEAAVRMDPANASAQRELAAALLADGQPELARRFYVRAVELNPADRLSQGFLACALHRLGRFDEARRWADRAGPGEWTPCLTVPVVPAPPVPLAPPR